LPNREVSFTEAFFCNECNAYEGDNHADLMSRGKRTSRRYKYKGKHADTSNPSNVGGQPMVYYASTKFGATTLAGNGEMPTAGAPASAAAVKLLPLPQPPLRARMDARTNPSAQRATQLRSVLARVYVVSRQNKITKTVP
jgi:hypothetical protein